MAKLFDPIEVGGLRLANRIVIAPMCQYSAIDGVPHDSTMLFSFAGTDSPTRVREHAVGAQD